jgi:hypothetical protein
MIDLFRHRIVETGRLPLFGFFTAFIVTFVLTRVIVRLIRANVSGWFGNVRAGDTHVHHVVFGVVLMLVGGIASLATPDAYVALDCVAAVVFGAGSALVLDEFALLLHLSDVYWTEKGRASVDAVFVAIAVTGLLLLGIRPFGFADAVPDPAGSALAQAYFASTVANLVLAVITLLKGKIWTGLIGLFLPVLLVVGAIRVARPGSPWSRWLYGPDSRKYQRAVRREVRFRRPLIRAKIWVQEFIAGRHDLIPPELLQRSADAAERARRRRLARAARKAAARDRRRAAARGRRRAAVRDQRRAAARDERRAAGRGRRSVADRLQRSAFARGRTSAAARRLARRLGADDPPPPPPPRRKLPTTRR